MKKFFAITAVFSAVFLLSACIQPQQPQVFGDTSGTITTIAQAKSMYDDSRIILDEFTFQDSTGTIRIDVEDHAWNGLSVTRNDKIRIYGKLDKEFFSSTIDVYQIELVR